MIPFKKCPVCDGEVIEKKVEKLLKGGNNTAVVNVDAEVCLHCGERLYSRDTVSYFERIRTKLKNQDVKDFTPLGQSYQIIGQI
ncbi:MAG: YgiT-type zinc finger protein [Spirochaetes bacterium]|nr:YgiT-type zinc finger protein [Spirochaetota bacterium]